MIRPIEVSADKDEVESARHLEIPIQGPAPANLLVQINGIAKPELDLFGTQTGPNEIATVHVYIDTDYKLRDDDVLVNSAVYACLASIDCDESPPHRWALDQTNIVLRTSKVIALHATCVLQNDVALHRIGYQVSLLIARTH
jgi:hypothetical protein